MLGAKVMIGLPWQKTVNPITSFCVQRLIDSRRATSFLHFGDAFVVHSRNHIAKIFLESTCDWLMMVDDDMVVPTGNADIYRAYTGFNFPKQFMELHALDRLLSHKKNLVGALYFGRQSLNGPAVYGEGAADSQEAAFARKGPHDICKPTRWVGTGCILIHRTVFEDIEKRFPRLSRKNGDGTGNWFTSTEASLVDSVEKTLTDVQSKPLTASSAYDVLQRLNTALALTKQENVLGVGEDVSFCLRAAAAGHTPHVDLGLRCGHLGTFCY
jgi:hypothetical protein